jgi:F420-dependent oxidoreductase-like protein
MRFSLWCNANQTWTDLLDEARHAEVTGWDGVWVADHFMGARESSPQECLAILAGLAAAVPRVTIGSLVLGNTYRHPAVVANAAATIDHISGGRLILGLGAGWQQSEHEAYGIPLMAPADRLDRLEEACAVLHGLLDGETVDFDGSYFSLSGAYVEPRPIQKHLPLLIGGGGERRTLRIVARWADIWNTWGGPDVVIHKGAILDRWCEEEGRDPSLITRSAQVALYLSDNVEWLESRRSDRSIRPTVIGTPEQVVEVMGEYRDAGVSEVIVPDMTLGSGSRRTDTIDMFRERVAVHFK